MLGSFAWRKCFCPLLTSKHTMGCGPYHRSRGIGNFLLFARLLSFFVYTTCRCSFRLRSLVWTNIMYDSNTWLRAILSETVETSKYCTKALYFTRDATNHYCGKSLIKDEPAVLPGVLFVPAAVTDPPIDRFVFSRAHQWVVWNYSLARHLSTCVHLKNLKVFKGTFCQCLCFLHFSWHFVWCEWQSIGCATTPHAYIHSTQYVLYVCVCLLCAWMP